jgi:carbamoyltransferase
MNILAMNFNHDGSAVILADGVVAGHVTTERFSRKKKHPGVRRQEIEELERQSGLSLDEIDIVYVVNYRVMDSPEVARLYGTDLADSWVEFELGSFRGWTVTATTIRILGRELECVVNPGHHVLHSALAYYFSPFQSAITFSYDPVGAGAHIARGNKLQPIDLELRDISGVYDEVSRLVGFPGLFGAGKTMGLAPYGRRDDPRERLELERLADSDLRGDAWRKAAVASLTSLAERAPVYVEQGPDRWNASLAFLLQALLEGVLTRQLDQLADVARSNGVEPNLCLGGGTALNSVANQVCFARSRFRRLYLHPCCGDDGTPLGAALLHYHHVLGNPKRPRSSAEAMYSVRSYSAAEVDAALARHANELVIERTRGDVAGAARLLAEGKIMGWFQGAGEVGPRALGNRSILCDPRRADAKADLNLRVKKREMFRPFAPSVLAEHSSDWFGLDDSPFMLRVAPVLRGGAPAITHVDGTARPQTVARTDNPRFHAVIEAFRGLTGVPLVLNTSFNAAGEPLVETPDDAVRCFLRSGMDALVFPGILVSRAPAS